MERLTRPDLNVDPGTDRFLSAKLGGKEIDWKQSRDSTLNVLINGPTSNGFCKDIFRKMVRDLYGQLKAYEDTGLTPEEIKDSCTPTTVIIMAGQALGVHLCRLRELAEADKDGRCVVLPCKVGDTAYYLNRPAVILDFEVIGYIVDERGAWSFMGEHLDKTTGDTYRCCPDTEKVGKTVFFTREEAERALQEMEGRKDGV